MIELAAMETIGMRLGSEDLLDAVIRGFGSQGPLQL
jgi:hypothetical protein